MGNPENEGKIEQLMEVIDKDEDIQWCAIEFLHLLHKPYWNRVTLAQDYVP